MNEISEEVIEDIAKALHDWDWACGGYEAADAIECWAADAPSDKESFRDQARAALAIAAPFIERQVRDKIATEIEAAAPPVPLDDPGDSDTTLCFKVIGYTAWTAAAKIARDGVS